MHYKCKKCNYEFDIFITPHPHPINSFITVVAYGCPVCMKAQARSKVCPQCGSTDLAQSVETITKEKQDNGRKN